MDSNERNLIALENATFDVDLSNALLFCKNWSNEDQQTLLRNMNHAVDYFNEVFALMQMHNKGKISHLKLLESKTNAQPGASTI